MDRESQWIDHAAGKSLFDSKTRPLNPRDYTILS